MRRWLRVAGAVVLLAGGLRAQEDSLAKIQKEVDATYTASKPGQKPTGPTPEQMEKFIQRALDLGVDHKGEAAGFDAYVFVASMSASVPGKEVAHFTEAMDAIVESWLDDDRVAELLLTILARPAEAVAAKAKEYRAWIVRDSKAEGVKCASAYLDMKSREAAVVDLAGAKKLIAEFETLKKKYGEKSAAYGRTWAKMIDDELDGLKVIGTAAQEISGKDLDGVDFKLSDYRGKVVLLDFWGYW